MRAAPTFLLAATGLLLASSPALADRRAFTRTYEYMTMPEGETELEIYSTQSRSTWDDPAVKAFDLQLEIEHGITEHWDVSLYHVFSQSTYVDEVAGDVVTEPLHFDEIKLRTRYRFAERGELPVDMLVYAEAIKVFGEGVYEAELKGIFARDFDRLTAVVNPVFEVEFGPAVDEAEVKLGYAAGVTYEVVPEWKVGAESWGEQALEEDADFEAAVGPAISWAPASTFWATTTAGFGITEATDDFSVRLLLGMHL